MLYSHYINRRYIHQTTGSSDIPKNTVVFSGIQALPHPSSTIQLSNRLMIVLHLDTLLDRKDKTLT
jgi:hypothetical protein